MNFYDATNRLLKNYIQRDIISVSDIVKSTSEEETMKTIISKVHKYKITPPKEGAKDQRWFTYVDDETKPKGRRRIAKNTESALYEFLLEFYDIDTRLENNLTFSELFEEWCSYKESFVKVKNSKKSLSISTITRYRTDFNKCLADSEFASTSIKDITSVMIEKAMQKAIDDNELKESYAKNLLGYVRNAFAYAYRQRYISVNEFLFVDENKILASAIPVVHLDKDRVLTRREFNAILEATRIQQKKNPLYLPNYAIELAMLTGMRVGELAALHWSDIRNGKIFIDYSEHRLDYKDHRELVIGEPKNQKHRVFPMNSAIKDLFDRVRALGFDSEFVFGNNEKRFTAHDISCACYRRAKEANVQKVSIHGIRRTVASELRKEFSEKLVSSLLGHLEKTDNQYYNYDNSEFEDKKVATEHLCSNVLTFKPKTKNKKRQET